MSDIKQECKEKIYTAIEESYVCSATIEILDESLDEVYRKAQVLDRIEDYLADQQAYDWGDEYTLNLIAEKVEKVVMEEE